MNRLPEWLSKACTELGLRAELGYKLKLPNMPELTTIAWLPSLGAANGMLVVADYDDVRELSRQLRDAGYAFSVLGEPGPQEEFDLQSFKDMFAEWGWHGELSQKPSWMS